MTEVDWGSEANEAPKAKKRIPTWAWFCGGGCLLAIVAAAIAAFALFRAGASMMDQEKQSAALGEVIAFDPLPEGTQIVGVGMLSGLAPGIDDQWMVMVPGSDSVLQVTKYSGDTAEEIRENIKSGELGASGAKQFGVGIHEYAHGEQDIQGRTLPWLRFQTYEKSADPAPTNTKDDEESKGGSDPFKVMREASKQRLLLLDVTAETHEGALILQFQRVGAGPPIEAAELAEVLRPFHIGPNR